ncbi:peptidase family M1-domain-containing protein [Cladochytrium replicatum]|nr:peptidase family M1-domain-containing protein [Cladochytrium replicatum]
MCTANSTNSATAAPGDRNVLPKTITPTHYDVVLTPNPLPPFKYNGTVTIHLNVNDDITKISTNALELEIVGNAKLTVVHAKSESTQESTGHSYDESLQAVVFEFANVIPAGSTATLLINFIGEHNDKMSGFYRSAYKDSNGNEKFMVVTQFESSDARRAFPCADEPALKATFDITLKVDPALTALSNMNLVEETIVDGLKVVKYARTPIMSTYLVAFAVAEYEYIEDTAHPKQPADAKPIAVRVYTPPGKKEEGRFALEVSCRVLEYFSEYFDIAYPLPKCDHVAIPDFSAGAMENWGLITYREHALLYSEASSSADHKQRVAYVVSHELAHQWFGNLVTMEWWSDLWLNEGFATFVGILAADTLFPEWNLWTKFITTELAGGMRLDSMRSSHPIEVPVADAVEVNQIFDAISYLKGASVIRMLCATLSQEHFMNGVRIYLKRHKYANASTIDLWTALGESSGVNVAKLLYGWTKLVGFPLVTVEKEVIEDDKITLHLSQTRFLVTGDLTAEEEANTEAWFIPLRIVTHLNPNTPTDHVLSTKTGTITVPYSRSEFEYYKLNFNATGIYRVKMTEYAIERFGKILRDKNELLAIEDRVNLVQDTFHLARAGYVSMTLWLSLINNLGSEKSFIVLDDTNTNLSDILTMLYRSSPAVKTAIQTVRRNIFAPKVSTFGFEFSESEPYETKQLRTLVLAAAGRSEDPSTVAELQARFERFVSGDASALNPDLRGLAMSTALKHCTDPGATLAKVLDVYKSATSADLKIACLSSLGFINTFDHAKRVLALTSDSTLVKPQDAYIIWNSLSGGSPLPELVRPYLWDQFKAQFNDLHAAFAGSMGLFGHICGAGVRTRAEDEFADEVAGWMAGKDCDSEGEREDRIKKVNVIKRPMDQGVERVRSNALYLKRDLGNVEKWCTERFS